MKPDSGEEISEDHHCRNDDECDRVEEAGGEIYEVGKMFRVMGTLAVTRAVSYTHLTLPTIYSV